MRTLILLAVVSLPFFGQSPFWLKPGDRVVFFGDSITDQRLYTTFVETFAVTRFPKANFSFIHSGWGGDRVSGGGGGPIDVRIWRDILPYNPTVVTIMLGMNDGRYRPFDQGLFDEYAKGTRHIVSSLKRQLPASRITLIQPSPFDDVTRSPGFEGGYNGVLLRYGSFLKDLSSEEGLFWADMNSSVVAALTKANTTNPADAAKLIPDRIHPGAAGHLLMAKALLEAWNAPPLVSEVEIDAAQAAVRLQRNTSVTNLKVNGKSISWQALDEALPMPIDFKDQLTSLAVQSSAFHAGLNQQPLKVNRLKPGNYRLTIDGNTIGSFTADQLAGGINLAEWSTPMVRQGRRGTRPDSTARIDSQHALASGAGTSSEIKQL